MKTLREILEGKATLRRRLARLPVAEKLRLVERLAERTRQIRQARPAVRTPLESGRDT